MKAQVTISQLTPLNALSAAVMKALEDAQNGKTKVSKELLSVSGMSGKIYRKFINNLVDILDDARYLEVGSWAGSTLCSVIYKNKVQSFAIDNWSQFGGPQDQFFKNLGRFSNPDARISFLNSDFRAVRYDSIGKYNIYLFDGPHERQDQYDGLAMARVALDDRFIFIVDDWNWPDVRNGTLDAIKDAGWKIEFDVQVRSTGNDIHPGAQGLPVDQDSDWHNGYFIGVLSR